jgi:hypothetical protein
MISTLHAFGFGYSFIKWIRTLCINASNCTVHNGWLSEHFATVRQGCPISALLFILDLFPKVGHVKSPKVTKSRQRSTSAFVGNEMPDQDLTFEKSQRSPKVTKGHERSTITFVAIVMLDQDLTF